MSEDVIVLKKEGGKKITVRTFGGDAVLTVWRKTDGVVVSLLLNRMEAQRLARMLIEATKEAKP
jgi:hypothetical protein